MIEVDVVVVSNFRNFLVADEVMSTVDLTASSMDPGQDVGGGGRAASSALSSA